MVIAAALEDYTDLKGEDECILDVRRAKTRVAAAYAQLALLENSRRIARNRERRQRCESLLASRALSELHPEKNNCSNDNFPQFYFHVQGFRTVSAEDLLLELRSSPLHPDTLGYESFWPMTILRKQQNLHQSAVGDFKGQTQSSAYVCFHDRACLAISDLHQKLLNERSSRRRIHAASLAAGIRAANAAKRMVRVAQANAYSERHSARRDALREARQYLRRVFRCIFL